MARFPGATVKARQTAATTWIRRPEDVQVKILRLGFKDRATGGFIGGP
jgi:hypothetical protein